MTFSLKKTFNTKTEKQLDVERSDQESQRDQASQLALTVSSLEIKNKNLQRELEEQMQNFEQKIQQYKSIEFQAKENESKTQLLAQTKEQLENSAKLIAREKEQISQGSFIYFELLFFLLFRTKIQKKLHRNENSIS